MEYSAFSFHKEWKDSVIAIQNNLQVARQGFPVHPEYTKQLAIKAIRAYRKWDALSRAYGW